MQLIAAVGLGPLLVGVLGCKATESRAVSPLNSRISHQEPRPFFPHTVERFSNGAVAKVTFLRPGDQSIPHAWTADGTQTEIPESHSHEVYTFGSQTGDNRYIVVNYTISGLPSSEGGEIFKQGPYSQTAVLGGLKSQGGGTFGPSPIIRPNSNDALDIALGNAKETPLVLECSKTFFVPNSWKTADLYVPLGVGKFKTVGERQGAKGDLQITIEGQRGTQRVMEEGKPKDVPGDIFSKLTFNLPPAIDQKEWRLVAFDKKGKAINLMPFPVSPFEKGPAKWQASAFAAPSEIARLVLEARDYEWVKLQKVHLYAGKDRG